MSKRAKSQDPTSPIHAWAVNLMGLPSLRGCLSSVSFHVTVLTLISIVHVARSVELTQPAAPRVPPTVLQIGGKTYYVSRVETSSAAGAPGGEGPSPGNPAPKGATGNAGGESPASRQRSLPSVGARQRPNLPDTDLTGLEAPELQIAAANLPAQQARAAGEILGQQLARPAAPAPRVFVPPELVRNEKRDITVIQELSPVELEFPDQVVPSVEVSTFEAPKVLKPFNAPGTTRRRPEAIEAPTPPEELALAPDIQPVSQPKLALPAAAPKLDVSAPKPAQPKEPEGDPIRLLALSNQPVPEQDNVVIPAGNVVGRDGTQTVISSGQGLAGQAGQGRGRSGADGDSDSAGGAGGTANAVGNGLTGNAPAAGRGAQAQQSGEGQSSAGTASAGGNGTGIQPQPGGIGGAAGAGRGSVNGSGPGSAKGKSGPGSGNAGAGNGDTGAGPGGNGGQGLGTAGSGRGAGIGVGGVGGSGGSGGDSEIETGTSQLADGSTVIRRAISGTFDTTVVQSTPTDRFPESRGLLTGRPIYSVYVAMGTGKDWVMYYTDPKSGNSPQSQGAVVNLGKVEDLDAPYPYVMVRPNVTVPAFFDYVLVFGGITAGGQPENLRIVRSSTPAGDEKILAALKEWQFRPARRDATNVAVQFLIAIPVAGL